TVSIFSLPCNVNIRQLSSFPTRRSSDLNAASQITGNGIRHILVFLRKYKELYRLHLSRKYQINRVGVDPHHHVTIDNRGYFCRRSEEHTSELQSRFDLVCRLLLETKNT